MGTRWRGDQNMRGRPRGGSSCGWIFKAVIFSGGLVTPDLLVRQEGTLVMKEQRVMRSG